LVKERNWLSHDFFRIYSRERLSEHKGVAQEAVQLLDRLAQNFKDASMRLLALRTRITPAMDSEEKMLLLWATHGPTPSSDAGRPAHGANG
jgi:hypothetical protein